MGKFFNDHSARCTACGTYLTSMGLARNDRHLYPIGQLYGCACGASKVWTNSIRNEKALLAHYATGKDYYQGFCNDLYDSEGREIVFWRDVDFIGEDERGRTYGTYEGYKLFKAGQGPDSTLVVWPERFSPAVEGSQELIDEYEKYADTIRQLLAQEVKTNPASAVVADERDLLDAIQHADLYGDQGWTLDDFKIVSLGEVPLGRIREYEDWGAWIDVDPEDYVGLSVEERLAKLAEFRGPRWAERAAGWLKNGVPPIVVIDAPIVDEHSVHRQIGDGRGRINFALAMGLKRLPVVLMKWKHPLQPAKRTNPADWLWSKTKARCLKRGDVMQLMVHGEEEPSAWVVKTARHGSWARERMVQVALKRFGDPSAKIQEFKERWYLNDEVIVSYRLGLDCDENPEARRASR